jgi:hypothetical protein
VRRIFLPRCCVANRGEGAEIASAGRFFRYRFALVFEPVPEWSAMQKQSSNRSVEGPGFFQKSGTAALVNARQAIWISNRS